MIDRIIIIIFFCIFLFIPLFNNITSNSLDNTIETTDKSDKSWHAKSYGYFYQNQIINAIANISPSVVGISVIKTNNEQPKWEIKDGIFYPYTKKTSDIKSLGSGLIYSNNGYVITNTHVIEDATQIFVTLSGGIKFEATISGYDTLTDIALLKVDATNLPVPTFGNLSNLIVGQMVIALGNPLGLFDLSYEPTATMGIISGLNIDFGFKNGGYVYRNMIQTDASINEGNSGGPLINIQGEVIGLNTFIMTGSNYNQGSIGIGFSIPINRVQDIVHDLIVYGEVKRAYNTGLKIKPLNDNVQKYLNTPFDYGVVIIDVEKQSAAMDANLKIGDLILKVDDIVVNSNEDIHNINRLNFRKAGDQIKLEIWRDGSIFETMLDLKSYQ